MQLVCVCVCVMGYCLSREIESYHNLSARHYKVSCLSLMFVTGEKKRWYSQAIAFNTK